eukprot:m51a1_g10043 hypothetical protein (290) ;mRNA; f:26731-27706
MKQRHRGDEEDCIEVVPSPEDSQGKGIRVPFHRRHRVALACAAVAATALLLLVRSAGREGTFSYTMVQCAWKSWASLDSTYRKSGRVWNSLDDIGEGLVTMAVGDVGGFLNERMPTDKAGRHNYTTLYDSLLAVYRAGDITLLEVGVKKGGSIVLWREYLTPGSFVYGADIDPAIPTFTRDAHIKTLVVDSRDAAEVDAALGGLQFDVIVDDGNHYPTAQRDTFNATWRRLKPSGVYIIEDVTHPRGLRRIVGKILPQGWTTKTLPDSSGEHCMLVFPPGSLALAQSRD